MSFDHALAFTLAWEGGYSNHPRDPGGSTNLGVTQRTLDIFRRRHVDWNLPADVRNLTRPQAARIYRAGYWDPVRAGELPEGVALFVFDVAVNHGPGRAIRWLQKAVGADVDGVVGPKTINLAWQTPERTVIRELGTLRGLGYVATGNMETFGVGWFRRLMGCVQEATRLAGRPDFSGVTTSIDSSAGRP